RWRGKVLVRVHLASGTMRAVWGMIIERGLKQTGDTAAGFQWLRRLDAQTKEYVLNGPLLDQKIVRQEGLVTIWDLPDILLNRRDGLQLGYLFPKSGTPVIEDAVGVVRDARHPAAARAFVEYVGSVDAQLLATREAYRLPARLDLPVDSLPPWARAVRSGMKVADVDWDVLAARGADWMRYWDETVRGQGEGAVTAFVSLDGVRKRWSPATVVGPVSLEIARGEIVALLGPSGSGKTTVLRLLAGFETPDAGRIAIADEDVTALPPARRRCGM